MKLEHNDVDFWSALYFFPEIVKGGVTVARTDLVLYPGTLIFVSYLYPGTFIFVSYLLSYLDPGIFIFVFIFVFKFCNHN